jgi:uncharacterized protein (TIGR02594 family)
MDITPFLLAQRFIGLREMKGSLDNPQIMAMLSLDMAWPDHDEVPWCSAFVNYICWLLRVQRSKDLRARSWLEVGMPVVPDVAMVGFDVVIIKRGGDDRGPEVINAPGHVGFYAGREFSSGAFHILGGNQNNQVSVAPYDCTRLLGIRRLR